MHPILQEIDSFYSRFGEDSARYRTKAIGAVTNEVIRKRLIEEGIAISGRDAFIEGFPTEWDLVVPKRGKEPELGCIWLPTDVLAVIEIKYSGLYDREAIQRLNQTFSRLTKKYPHIKPYYAHSDEVGRLFRSKSATHSDEVGHPLRGCAAGRRLMSHRVSIASIFDRSLRIEGPFRSILYALCTTRSRMASAMVGSLSASCQLATGS